MSKNINFKNNPGLVLVISYFLLLTVNSIVIWLANLLIPNLVVLGTWHIPYGWAILHSMGTLALINTFAIPFVREMERVNGKMFTSTQWMIFYFLLNFAGIWLISRFADQFGLGISSWLIAVGLAIVVDVVQGMAMMQLEKYRQK